MTGDRLSWTKRFVVDVAYCKSGLKRLVILDYDTEEQGGCCIACGKLLNPFLSVSNRDGTPVLEKKICLSCGYCRFTRMPRQEWFDKFYRTEWDIAGRRRGRPAGDILRGTEGFIAKLLEIAPDLNSTILDVGTGFGGFLEAAKQQGYTNFHGIETSEHRSRYCREELGFDVVTESIENYFDSYVRKKDYGIFDVIHSCHVLEHIRDIDLAVEKLYQMLRPGGRLIIGVPYWIRDEGVIHMAHFLGHIHHFTPESFALFFQRHGFEVEDVDVEHIDDTLCIIARKPGGKLVERDKFQLPSGDEIQSQVAEKISREFGHKDLGSTDKSTYFIYKSSPILKPKHYDLSLSSELRLRDYFTWCVKESFFGVSHNNDPIRGMTGNMLRAFNPRLLVIKVLSRAITFDPIEMSGRVTSCSNDDLGSFSYPMVEFRYSNKGGIAFVK